MREEMQRKSFIQDQSGEIGIKTIAITVAVIVIIGVAIGFVSDNLGSWISQLWNMFINQIEGLMS